MGQERRGRTGIRRRPDAGRKEMTQPGKGTHAPALRFGEDAGGAGADLTTPAGDDDEILAFAQLRLERFQGRDVDARGEIDFGGEIHEVSEVANALAQRVETTRRRIRVEFPERSFGGPEASAEKLAGSAPHSLRRRLGESPDGRKQSREAARPILATAREGSGAIPIGIPKEPSFERGSSGVIVGQVQEMGPSHVAIPGRPQKSDRRAELSTEPTDDRPILRQCQSGERLSEGAGGHA